MEFYIIDDEQVQIESEEEVKAYLMEDIEECYAENPVVISAYSLDREDGYRCIVVCEELFVDFGTLEIYKKIISNQHLATWSNVIVANNFIICECSLADTITAVLSALSDNGLLHSGDIRCVKSNRSDSCSDISIRQD